MCVRKEGGKKMAYLEFVKSGKSTYVYLTEYQSAEAGCKKKEKRVLSLGNVNEAYKELEYWKSNEDNIPFQVKEKDYSRINHWMNMINRREGVAY